MKLTDEQDDRAWALSVAASGNVPRATAGYRAAVERVRMPGELGQYAATEWADIERPGGPVRVFVQHWEEAVEFTEAAITALAFDLLVLRDLASASSASGEAIQRQDQEPRG